MKAVIEAIAERMKLRNRQFTENLKIVQWYRENACARRGMPFSDAGQSDLLEGVISAISIGAASGSTSGGTDNQSNDTGTSSTNAGDGTTNKPVSSDNANPGISNQPGVTSPTQNEGGQGDTRSGISISISNPPANTGGDYPPPSTVSGGSVDNDGVSSGWKKAAIVLGTAATIATAGTGGALITNWLNGGNEQQPVEGGGGTVINIDESNPYIYPVLDWLEENEFHLPVSGRFD